MLLEINTREPKIWLKWKALIGSRTNKENLPFVIENKVRYIHNNFLVRLFYERNRNSLSCLYSLMQTLGEVGRTLERLYKPSTFSLGRTQQLSNSPNLLLVFSPCCVNTAKEFLFLN